MMSGRMRCRSVVAQAPALHDAGAVVLRHHVAAGDQALDDVDGLGLAHVEHERLLAAVVGLEVGAEAVRAEAAAPSLLTARLLDLDYLGAHVGEQHGARRPLLVPGEVQDADAGER